MQKQNTQTLGNTQTLSGAVTTLYCICDDFLKAIAWRDDDQARMSTAQVMTVALAAAALFHGNQEASRRFLSEHGYIPNMLSKSRFNRRLHRIPEEVWRLLMRVMAQASKLCDPDQVCLVDSCPVPVCDNIRICRCRLYPPRRYENLFRSYSASKRRYYYGLKLHLIVSSTGQPMEALLSPASMADIEGLRQMDLDLPAGARIMADAAYTDYVFEDNLQEFDEVTLLAQRRYNSTRPHPAYQAYLCDVYRKRIETCFSTITEWFGRRLHAVTARGFELKAYLATVAYAILA